MYSTVATSNASTMPHGIVRRGSFTSSDTLSMSSKPMNEKNVSTDPAKSIAEPSP